MKKTMIIATVSTALFAAGAANAGRGWQDRSFVDRARVLDVDPIYATVETPVTETVCHRERVRHGGKHDDFIGTVAGALVGGVVGNHFGHGKGRDFTTAVGAMTGAVLGNKVARQGKSRGHGTETFCEDVTRYEPREEIVAYKVKYRYRGEVYKTRMSQDPGKYVEIRVTHEPIHF